MNTASYVGRFAPSPTGPLHAGSLVAALASWLDARAWNAGRGGRWLVRIEDVDTPRCVPGAAERILAQLATCGLLPDAPPLWQSHRGALYQQALDQLVDSNLAYPCACSRKEIADSALARDGTRRYPGTCRDGLPLGRGARAWRCPGGSGPRFRRAPGPPPATWPRPACRTTWTRWVSRSPASAA